MISPIHSERANLGGSAGFAAAQCSAAWPTHLDLFSGIGGFALGAERAEWRTIGFAEIDPFASAVLKRHWPDVPNYGDIRTIPTIRCDLITGGFPCQPWSEAGHQRGASDDRHLWPAMRDVISRCRPAWVLGENVSALFDLGLDMVLDDLESVGYSAQPFGIPSCAVGLAQIEGERCWIVAAPNGNGFDSLQEACRMAATPCPQAAQPEKRWGVGMFRGVSGRVWPAPVSTFDGVDYGLPGELDRARTIGNSISPQIAETLLRWMRQIHDDVMRQNDRTEPRHD